VKRAEELGVPRGKERAKLTQGESITFDVVVDGVKTKRTVKSEDCVGESEVPGVCPFSFASHRF
jgi:ribonuclease Z